MHLPDDIFETDIGVIAWPYLAKPYAPFGGVMPRYRCCLLFDFPDDLLTALRPFRTIRNPPIYWPIHSNAELNSATGQPTWFKWRLNASSAAFVPCEDLAGKLIAPYDVRPDDRVQLGGTFYTYVRPDNSRKGVGFHLRYVRRIGGPVRGEDV